MEKQLAYVEKGKEWLVTNGAEIALNIIALILILVIGKIVIMAICGTLNNLLKKSSRVSKMLRKFFVDTTRKILWVIVLMIGLQRIGINIAPLIAGLGVTGFILGFAFKDSLGNLAAGIMILLNQPFKIGDVVEVGGNTGCVNELNLMATTLNTPDNKRITIPNSSVWGGALVNYTANDTRRVDLIAGIGYSSDMQKAKTIIEKLLSENNKILDDPKPTVEVVELADSSVNFVVRPWCKTEDYWAVYFEVTRTIKEKFDENGIEIPFPQMDVHQK